jgi:nucleoside-diphosphate-sugar epimerase
MDTAVLIATCWGGADEIYAINVDANLRLMELLDPDRCRQVLYFSTASILDQQNQPMQAAGEIGTDYIRSKYLCHQKLAQLAIAPQITTLFPTLVFGGAADKPYSHISAGLTDVVGWMHLIRWLKADGSFHFIHAQDIAAVVRHLIEAPPVDGPRELVLGNPAITVNQAIADASAYLGYPLPWQIPVSLGLADFLIKTFKFRMAEWDRFCLHYRHFTYQNPVSPTTLGLPAYCPSLTRLLQLGGVDPWYPYGLPAAPL